MNAKHFLIYTENGKIIQSTPKDWARANQHEFPKHTFETSETTPTTDVIEALLIRDKGFNTLNDEQIFICYKL